MGTKFKYITIAVIALCIAVVFIVIKKKNAEIKSLKTQLDMEQVSSSELRQRMNDEKNYSKEYNQMIFSLRDSIDILKTQRDYQNNLITQLENEKNKIQRIDYSKHSDSDLSNMLLQLFAESDSLSR